MECFEQHNSPRSLQGQSYTFNNDLERAAILEKAFDYRGDVTLTLSNGQTIECYIYNRNQFASPPYIDVFLKGSDASQRFPYTDITALAFTGKDAADGKSYEAWKAKKQSERAAEAAKIEAEMREKGLL
ncbi:MAG: hypothetical protein NZM04_02075 [Methylacidiphilales bacterium]|nr:hypothetical protein [Candidatus Methylacidiphilales bacterium]MDW8349985.1 hypothetical protein [Verrucomicrobiae bacterium]